jgi:hypothetical protein
VVACVANIEGNDVDWAFCEETGFADARGADERKEERDEETVMRTFVKRTVMRKTKKWRIVAVMMAVWLTVGSWNCNLMSFQGTSNMNLSVSLASNRGKF